MPTGRAGQFNINGITNPGPYVINNLPTSFATGVPTNIEGMVGVGSWGPVNSVIVGTNQGDCASNLGTPQIRFADIATHVEAACQMGSAVNFRWVRVTDGTDTAATAQIQTNAGQATARYTGTLGNNVSLSFSATASIGAYAAVIQGPAGLPERFDNIFSGLQSVAVMPGTGYTSVPASTVSAPQIAGGVQAALRPTLTTVSQTIGSGGSGHVVNDVVTFGAGLQIKVLTVTSGAIVTFSVVTPASVTSGSVPTSPMAQTGTTGAGTGATLTAVWGLGAPTVTYGSGYYSAMGAPLTVTLIGGGGTGGSYTPVMSFWAALATAINSGTSQRPRSNYIVFTPGASTAAPATGVATALSGGTDGAAGVGTMQLVGNDGLSTSRTGMYQLRGTGVDAFELCDCVDTAPWGAMLSMAIQEASYAIAAAPVGMTIEQIVALRQSAGIDDPQLKIVGGDPSFYDTYFGTRLVSPAAIVLGLYGNLSPEQGTINKQLLAVTQTTLSSMGVTTASADESVSETGGIDWIGQSGDLGVNYFTLLTGRNASSNTAARGDEYTRLTNFLIKTYLTVGRQFVGKLQSQQNSDPTRISALQTFDSFCQSLVNPSSGSGGYGMIDSFQNICLGPNDAGTNNTATSIQAGYLFLTSKNVYLNVVRYFVINLFGGGNVQISVQTSLTTPTVS